MTGPGARRPDEPADQLPADIGGDAVLALLRDRRRPQARLALATLSTRFPDLAEQAARDVVADRESPDALRSVAATELGHHAGRRSERALLAVLDEAAPTVLKHVARSLGRIGGADALAALGRVSATQEATARLVRFARSLIAYRLGRDDHLVDVPDLAAGPPVAEPTPLELRTVSDGEAEADWRAVLRALPATPMSRRGSLRFRCGHSRHWILLAEELGDRPAERLARAPMVAGAVLKYRDCPGHYSLDEYLLTGGSRRGRIDLVGVRESGITVHAGTVTVARGAVTFALGAHNPPYSRPIELGGLLDTSSRAIAFDRAVVGRARGAGARPRIPQRVRTEPG